MRERSCTAQFAAIVALVGSSHAQQGCVPVVAPLVVWDVTASTGQSGWGGWSHPTVQRFPPKVYASLPAGSAPRFVDAWSERWDYSHGSQPSSGFLQLSFDGAQFYSQHLVTAHWDSQFMIEDAWASVTLKAWIRGAPGTSVEVFEACVGGGAAARLNYSGSVSGGGSSSSFEGPTGGSFGHTVVSMPAVRQTTGSIRTFPQYPGETYSLLTFGPLSASMGAGQSCIMLCPGSHIHGDTSLESFVSVRLPQGLPPKIVSLLPVPQQVDGDYAATSFGDYVLVPPATQLELRVWAYDPDDGSSAGDGIVGHRWSRDGEPFGIGLGAWCAGATVSTQLEVDETQVWTVVAVDNEGELSPPKTIRLQSLPIVPLPWPGSAPPAQPVPLLAGAGSLPDGTFALMLRNAAQSVPGVLVLGSPAARFPILGGSIYSTADLLLPLMTDSRGEWALPEVPAVPNLVPLLLQCWTWSGSGAEWASSNGFLAL